MDNLAYKGWRSTRIGFALIFAVVATWGWLVLGKMDAATWAGFIEWLTSAYALSEVGAKGAQAYRDRQN